MSPIFLLLLFISILVLIEVVLGLIKKSPEKQQAEKRLKKLTAQKYEIGNFEFVKKVRYSDIHSLNSFFSKFPLFHRLVRLLEQADVKQTLGYFILTSLVGVAVGFGLTRINLPLGIIVAAVLGISPSVYIYLKKKKRMNRFEKQLPDAMDLIARSLKAGLAFSVGLKIVSDEFPDPVGVEFGRTVNEVNFGISTDEALKNLAARIDCPDLRFFVISVILQKETGGNLAEILENIARLVRERFKFQGKVRALSAEGRLSAILLVAVPFFLAGLILIINPDYIRALKDEPIGNMMVIGALIMMIIGVSVLKKMIDLKA